MYVDDFIFHTSAAISEELQHQLHWYVDFISVVFQEYVNVNKNKYAIMIIRNRT